MTVLLLGVFAGCVDVRSRPLDPTSPDGGSSEPSFVRITEPFEGELVSRQTLTQEPGLEVTFTGRFKVGQTLLLLVFGDQLPNTLLYTAEGTIETEGDRGATHVKMAPATLERLSELEILLRVLEGSDDRIISTDSVGVTLR